MVKRRYLYGAFSILIISSIYVSLCANHTYMTTKLTLSIDDQVIESAKKYAQGEGKSLSGLGGKLFKIHNGSSKRNYYYFTGSQEAQGAALNCPKILIINLNLEKQSEKSIPNETFVLRHECNNRFSG